MYLLFALPRAKYNVARQLEGYIKFDGQLSKCLIKILSAFAVANSIQISLQMTN
jgi:hypothetical protein